MRSVILSLNYETFVSFLLIFMLCSFFFLFSQQRWAWIRNGDWGVLRLLLRQLVLGFCAFACVFGHIFNTIIGFSL